MIRYMCSECGWEVLEGGNICKCNKGFVKLSDDCLHNPSIIIDIVKEEGAKIPTYAHGKGDSCFDIYSNECETVLAHTIVLVNAGIRFEIPRGYSVDICPKSGLALKHGITVLNTPGQIDSSYRGEIGVILHNVSNKDFFVSEGDKIAQGRLVKVEHVVFNEVDKLSDTDRGESGFGSTGIR